MPPVPVVEMASARNVGEAVVALGPIERLIFGMTGGPEKIIALHPRIAAAASVGGDAHPVRAVAREPTHIAPGRHQA